MLPVNTHTQVLADADAVARQTCDLVAAIARQAIQDRGIFRLVMAGGTTPKRAYELLAKTEQDWDKWELYWGDERCLPVDHPERNSHLTLPAPHRYPIPSELGAMAAAAAYAETIADKLPFDLVMLGMGEDGHTASLFPGFKDVAGLTVAVHGAPKPPPDRVSLTVSTLQNCRQQLVVITGAGKLEAIQRWQAGDNLPIAQVVKVDACVMLDRAAMPEI